MPQRNTALWIVAGIIVLMVLLAGLRACTTKLKEFSHKRDLAEAQLKIDHDSDGYCEHESECSDPEHKPGDCDDKDPLINPGAPECNADGLGDGINQNCNSMADDTCLDYDDDGDGYCEHGKSCLNDDKPGDCDDDNRRIYPGADEADNGLLDGLDNDCDGIIDNNSIWYDDDGDGYCEGAQPNVEEPECLGKAIPGDCDDTNPLIHPGEDVLEGELVDDQIYGDGIDNNCNLEIDEGAVDVDNDLDGFCEHKIVCMPRTIDEQEAKMLPNDCNDLDAEINPLATEVVNGIDDNCDGIIDNQTDQYDDDKDGFCEHSDTCLNQAKPGDCDDANDQVYPGADEGTIKDSGDGLDNDCNGLIDEGTRGYDSDGDDVAPVNGDCDDNNPMIYSGQFEWLDGYDNDCDGVTDEADGLADLTEAPGYDRHNYQGRSSRHGSKSHIYDVYSYEAYQQRIQSWSYDHGWNIAALDDQRILHLHHASDEPGADWVHTPENRDVVAVLGPDLDLKVRYQQQVENDDTILSLEQRVLLRFDQRERPVRLRLDMPDVPRPSVLVTTGYQIDTIGSNDSRLRKIAGHLNAATTVIPSVELDDPDNQSSPEVWDTTLVFWLCNDNTQNHCNQYLGHYNLDEVPVGCNKDLVLKVGVLNKIDLDLCRSAYSDSSSRQGVEARYQKVVQACTTNVGVHELNFTLTFSR